MNFLPTFGFGVLISGFLARAFGGNFMAGLVGGGILSPSWPVLFYLNIRVGGLLYQPPLVVDELSDVTEKTVNALVWGKTFSVGAAVNSVCIGLLVYVLLRLLYHKGRPVLLAYFRRHATDHQRRFRRSVIRRRPSSS